MPEIDAYNTIKTPSTGEYREKGSKFLAYAFEIESEKEFKTHLDKLKKEHFKARHHCFALIIGAEGDFHRYNDDGEPSGTAGLPIFNQIRSFGLSNIAIIVVRYFGGTKLGVPGLINAYKSAANDALKNADIIEKYIEDEIVIEYKFELTGDVMNHINAFGLKITESAYDPLPVIKCKIRKSKTDDFIKSVYSSVLNRQIEDISGDEHIEGLKITANA
jgi:uncharacterized YigZ family protein